MQYVVSKLHLPEAHALASGERITVAVIDTGIDGEHAELRGAVAGSFDAVKGERGASKHGTQMASAIAARGQLIGVAPAARILAVRAFDDAPSGPHGTTTRLVDALAFVASAGARVVNMSFAGTADDASVHAWITAIRRKGSVLVAAAGNNGPTAPPAYPAAYPEVIGVTATDVDDRLLKVANRGTYVSVAAPGVDIFVAIPGGGYDFTSGTSVAAAHVSGLAALLIARNPSLTADAVQAILMRTAKDLGLKGRDSDFGAGLVDAYEALLTQTPAATAERSLRRE
jgi:subtilisin family serine protease